MRKKRQQPRAVYGLWCHLQVIIQTLQLLLNDDFLNLS